MRLSAQQYRPLGDTGLRIPPIVFRAAALANARRVISDPTKLAIGDAWFRHVEAPVFVNVGFKDGDGRELESLAALLRRLDVQSEEVVILLSIDWTAAAGPSVQSNYDRVLEGWEASCRLLGDEYRPKLVSIGSVHADAWRAADELKCTHKVLGVGLATRDVHSSAELISQADWITLAGGFTWLRHPPEVRGWMADLAKRQIPIVLSGVFDGGFLVGGNRSDGRVLNADDTADRSLFTWRKSFVSLCEGHGITPAHACIQFALSVPGVVAVELGASFPDRVIESVGAACQKVPDNFWVSMKEEGLLESEYT